jgi:pimeloyl-ACP methyl ester carboxylesterase
MIEHAYAEVNSVRLHYAAAGSGRLIVFLHGFPEFWYMWKEQLEEFGQDHRAVALDMRGYNLSSKPAEVNAYRIEHLVEDVRGFAAHLGYEKFVLVGHDWGGVVAWAFALWHPALLERLVIINAPHPAIFERELLDNPAQRAASQYMLLLRSPQAEDALSANHYAALVEGVLKDGIAGGYISEEDRRAYLEAWSQPGALTGGLNYYRAARLGPPSGESERGLSETLKSFPSLIVKVPTLVIWGEKDPYLLMGNLEALEHYVANLTIRRVELGSHWVIHEKPDAINSYLREYLSAPR